jgi:hypothetical protein
MRDSTSQLNGLSSKTIEERNSITISKVARPKARLSLSYLVANFRAVKSLAIRVLVRPARACRCFQFATVELT